MNTPTKDQLTFRITRNSIARAQALAEKFGIDLDVSEIDSVVLACALFEMQEHHVSPPYDQLDDSYKIWANQLVSDHVEITVHAPASEWSVIALADRSDGAPMFHLIDPVSNYWTSETMNEIDFTRCDECGVHSQRNRAFIIRKDNMIRQIGGSCAKHLDLTKKIRDLLNGFLYFKTAIEEDFGMAGFFRNKIPLNVQLAMLLTEELISFEGYISRKAADATGRLSTRATIAQMLLTSKKDSLELRDNGFWKRAKERWLAGEGEALMSDVTSWLDSQPDDVFHRNIRTSIQNKSWQLGLICFAVAEIRNWRLAIKAKEKAVAPRCYEHTETTPEDVAVACQKPLAELGVLIGHDCSGKLKAPARKALSKVLPGVWTLISRASWESVYGQQDMVQFQREDGSRVKWITGSLDGNITWQKGEQYLILSASLGEDLGTHEKYGVQGRKISRAFIYPTDSKNIRKEAE